MTTKNYKTKDNYPTGGWCERRATCANDQKQCDKCDYQYDKYKEKK